MNTAELVAEAKKYPTEIARIKAAVFAIGRNEAVTDTVVANVLIKNEYARMNNRKRLVLTDKGKDFLRQMKKFSRRV